MSTMPSMKRTLVNPIIAMMAVVLLGACGHTRSAPKSKQDQGASKGDGKGDGGHGHGHGGDNISVLRYGKHTEIFVEYPPPVAGQDLTFTTHFTVLGKRFVPVRKGTLTVTFVGASGQALRIEAHRISRTGIFELTGKAPAAGEYTLAFELHTEGKRDHFAWKVVVYPSQTAADHRPTQPKPGGETLSFLKEQQWVIPFATTDAQWRPIRAGFEVAGTVEAEPGAYARLTAPIAGVVTDVVPTLRVGARVKLNQTLVSVEPVLLQSTDLPQLQVAVVHARQALKLAELRRDRLKTMYKARAVARLQVDQAEYEVRRQKATLQAAGSRVWLHQRSRKRQAKSGHGLWIRAPFAGTIVRRDVTPGTAVIPGQVLVELADLSRLRVAAHVSPDDLIRARQATGAAVRLPSGRYVALGHPPVVGASVNPQTRTVPLAYSYAAKEPLPLGSWVRVSLLARSHKAVAVPDAAVLDNDGQAVVLVQTNGESFAIRKVGLGTRDRGWVEITLGVLAGERVVTVGGYQMLLVTKLRGGAQLGHGHAH